MQPKQTEHICPGTYGLTHPGRGCWGQDVCGALVNPTCLQNNSRHCLSLGCPPLCIPSSRVGVGSRMLGASAKEGPREQVSRTGPKQTRTFPPEPGRHVGGESLLLAPRSPSRLCAPDQVQRARGSSGVILVLDLPGLTHPVGVQSPITFSPEMVAGVSSSSIITTCLETTRSGSSTQGSLGSHQLCGQCPRPSAITKS